MKVIYKITYSNEKIYIGKDFINILNYLGIAISTLSESDSAKAQLSDFSVRKEIIWDSETISDSEFSLEELSLITQFQSINPRIDYNR